MKPPIHSVIDLTCALVRIPSVNPDGDPGTARTGEQACAEFVAEFLKECGAATELIEIAPERPNVLGRFPSNGKGKPRILFAPHTDTVGVGGMTIDPFGGELRDGRVWGRGASDTKGPMASMLWALHELRDEIADLPVEVHFVGFMSEESSQLGSRHFAEQNDGYALAIIAEPTSLQVVHKHKGCLWADIVVEGVAAHGATPERGVNAITKMMPIINALDTEFRELLIEVGGVDDVLNQSTINIGMINGGTRSNIVPDQCVLRVDIRFTPHLHAQGGALRLLEDFVQRLDPQATVHPLPEAPPLNTSASNPFVQKLVQCGASLTGAPWFCDAAYLAAKGMDAIAIGPGSIAQAHTKDEWIATDDLEAGVAFFMKFLRSL
jgi:acetylornithine deacetylase/succinyl-diaminopimelate desuccinylase-like protein